MASDAKVRLLLGPIGCVSAETEVLTANGWLRIDQWDGNAVAVWDSATSEMRFEAPSAYINEPCDELIWFRNKHALSMVLSDEHRVPVFDWNNRFKVKTAASLERKPSKNTIPTTFVPTSERLGLTDDQIRLWVAIAADGCYPKHGKQCAITARKERKKTRIRDLLTRNHISFVERTPEARPTETIFTFARPDHPKHFDTRWWMAAVDDLRVLLDEVSYWDGLYDHEECRFSTTRKDQADIVQFAAHACGRRATISRIVYENDNWNDGYSVHITTPGSAKALVQLRGGTTDISRVPTTDGRKYCFTTSTGFFVARHDGRVFVTGNSGKSTVNIVEIFRRCAEMPKCKDGFRRSRWVIIRNTLPQLRSTTLKTWLQWFPDTIAGKWKEQDKTFYLQAGDIRAEILFLPLDSPDDAARLLSLELTGAFINEAREVNPEIIQAVFSRLGRYPSRAMLPKDTTYWYGLIMDTNPPSRDSWLYTKFEEERPDGWEIYRQPGGLDPDAENKENLPPTYYEDMMNGATQDWIDVHVHGKYGRSLTGRPVFEKTFTRSFHVSNQVLQPLNSLAHPVIIGLDFGRTPAAVLGQRNAFSRLHILDALYQENIGLENFLKNHLSPLLKERFPYNKFIVVGDPAGWAKSQLNEENAFDVLKKCGFTTAVPASTNDIDKRINAVESLLMQQIEGKPMVTFSAEHTSKGMKHLIAAMDGGYKYKRKNDGSFEVTPLKDKFSHCADATQYLALGASLQGGTARSQAVPVKRSGRRRV